MWKPVDCVSVSNGSHEPYARTLSANIYDSVKQSLESSALQRLVLRKISQMVRPAHCRCAIYSLPGSVLTSPFCSVVVSTNGCLTVVESSLWSPAAVAATVVSLHRFGASLPLVSSSDFRCQQTRASAITVIVHHAIWKQTNGQTERSWKPASRDATTSECMLYPLLHSTYDLDLWPLTLKTFQQCLLLMNICAKFHWNPSKYRDCEQSRKTGVNRQTTVGQLDDQKSVIQSPPIVGSWRINIRLNKKIVISVDNSGFISKHNSLYVNEARSQNWQNYNI